MPRSDVPLEVSPPHQHFTAELASVRCFSVGVQSDVFVQITWISERSKAVFAFQGLVACVGSAQKKSDADELLARHRAIGE